MIILSPSWSSDFINSSICGLVSNGHYYMGRENIPDGRPGAGVPMFLKLPFDSVQQVIGKKRDEDVRFYP